LANGSAISEKGSRALLSNGLSAVRMNSLRLVPLGRVRRVSMCCLANEEASLPWWNCRVPSPTSFGSRNSAKGLGDRRALLADPLRQLLELLIDRSRPRLAAGGDLWGIDRQHSHWHADVGRVPIGHIYQGSSAEGGQVAPAGDHRICTASIMSPPHGQVLSGPSDSIHSRWARGA